MLGLILKSSENAIVESVISLKYKKISRFIGSTSSVGLLKQQGGFLTA